MLYYSRHLIPYDISLCLLMLALLIGLMPPAGGLTSSLCGLIASLAFLTYNGYWAGALTVMAFNVVRGSRHAQGLTRRAASCGIGFLAPIVLLVALNLAVQGPAFLEHLRTFMESVTMGTASEGWSLPWEYLWHSEHGLMLVWALGGGVTVAQAALRRSSVARTSFVPLGMVMAMYGLLVLTSTGLAFFVVSARHARQLVPFLCLAAAPGFNALYALPGVKRLLLPAAYVLILAQAIANQAPVFTLVYPGDFEAQAGGAGLPRIWTVAGPPDSEGVSGSRYLLVNVGVVWPVLGVRQLPPGQTVAWAPQPLEFAPYQYEGYRPEERAILRSTDISMRVVDVGPVQ
jgi:hypothetical protein